MNDIQSDRTVLPFPAELRLKIYRNLVKKTYLALEPTPERRGPFATRGITRKPFQASAGLVILRVSKATSAEALNLLYEESVFLFEVDFTAGFWYDGPPKMAVALMKNVSFEVSNRNAAYVTFRSTTMFGGRPTQDLLSNRTIELFTGTGDFRNIMRIKFKDWKRISHYYNYRRLKFTESMKNLGGFRKLVVEYESLHSSESEDSRYESSDSLERHRVVRWPKSQCEKQKESALGDLEPMYGPAVQGAVRGDSTYTCYLEFYPRQHLASQGSDSQGLKDTRGGDLMS